MDGACRILENGESLLEGAWRETKEETQAEVAMRDIFSIFNIPQINQIYVIYLADIEDNSFGPTSESLDVKLFSYDEIPWEELAFPFVPKTIKHYYECLEKKIFQTSCRGYSKKEKLIHKFSCIDKHFEPGTKTLILIICP